MTIGGRYFKELSDVETLIRTNALDTRSEKMGRLFLKYGTLNIDVEFIL